MSCDKKELRLTVEPQNDNTIIHGALIFFIEKKFGLTFEEEKPLSKILRRVYLYGRAQNSAPLKLTNLNQYQQQDSPPIFSDVPKNIQKYFVPEVEKIQILFNAKKNTAKS